MTAHKKKILIISLAAGSGHIQAAKALIRTAEADFPQLICRHIDIAEYITPLLKRTTIHGYGFLVSHMPHVWSSLFRLSDNKTFIKAYRALTDYLKMLNSFEFLHEVEAFAPDHIICTHFLPAEILTHAMKKQKKNIPITLVLTDYGIHPIMIVKGLDGYVVPTKLMGQELINDYSIPASRVHEFGIPIDPRFYEHRSPEEIRLRYSLSPQLPVILILSGGEGLIKISKTIKALFSQLHHPVAIFAIAGKNKKLFKLISKLTPPSHITYQPLGWTDDIPNLMSIANVVVSKPGGLTTTECVVSGVPLVAINPIPGQEEFNINYLTENNFGAYAKNLNQVVQLVQKYLSPTIQKNRPVGRSSAQEIINYIATP